MNFYSVIIGSELLNGRRSDAHFSFLNDELLKRGWEQKASFVIKDEPSFIEDVFRLVKSDPEAVLFCFGGIGATPDDYTRVCAANVFTEGKMEINEDAKKCIVDKFGDESYPHRINMANLPINASLLKNIVTNIPGFGLEDKYFFTPGFPSMAHSMIIEALDKYYPSNRAKIRLSLKALCSENDIIDTMKLIPTHIDISSLPQINGDKRAVIISVASYDELEAKKYFDIFVKFVEKNNIEYFLTDK
ncbi:MAG: competence/damage-inducible protein A [Arcobacteraceae bacterium]|nr:competence/damage-inducible protein A [Arcobacteraceae bacterium]